MESAFNSCFMIKKKLKIIVKYNIKIVILVFEPHNVIYCVFIILIDIKLPDCSKFSVRRIFYENDQIYCIIDFILV